MNIRKPRLDGKMGTFGVPAASGGYAALFLVFGENVLEQAKLAGISRITVVSHSAATDCDVELWLPKFDASAPFTLADYSFSGDKIDGTGRMTVELAGYPGAAIRVKSGGNAGNTVVSATIQ